MSLPGYMDSTPPPESGQNHEAPKSTGNQSGVCCDETWESAYQRFETPEQEIRKFTGRLIKLGARNWPRDAEIVELFCGRGNGLQALTQLGFSRVEGIDLSPTLLAQYHGPARCHVGDCRKLLFGDHTKDIAVAQGGLHHLEKLPEDLAQTLAETARVLRPKGRLVVVEPWDTPFLRLAHLACRSTLARRLSPRVDALATMIHHERATYEQWLRQPEIILALLRERFEPVHLNRGWGKLMWVGRKRSGH